MELIFKEREWTGPLGRNSRGIFVPKEGERRAIFIPSWGLLEEKEIDYILEAEQEKEADRMKRRNISLTRLQMNEIVEKALTLPAGTRQKYIRGVLGDLNAARTREI